MCSDRAPSFVQNIRKQGRGRYVFPSHFAVLILSGSFSMYAYCRLIVAMQAPTHKVLVHLYRGA